MVFKTIIKLDFDSKNVRNGHLVGKRLAEVQKYLGVSPERVIVKETGKGFHVSIEVKSTVELNAEAVAFLQLFLGSDKYRELNNMRRILGYRALGIPPRRWNVLFNAKKRSDGSITVEKVSELSREFERRLWDSFEKWRRKLAG